ncbi:phage integrase [Photobacterium phosphoreum]|uniref:phage integrase n=1 Tax=Photobacterium phosphoreum TaxID=659 RepID=UPI000D168CEC|nr:tyrosine-type recombinase/integrase [Photobacterium phosphoreum]PSU57706.1 integrase [Photobacterium phosphoreum]
MSVRNLKDKSKNPWLCECYPQGREGKRIRKRFSTKGEAITFERFTMREIEEKPWLAQKTDNRRLLDILKLWWCLHGHSVKTGKQTYNIIKIFIQKIDNPLAIKFTAQDYLHYRSTRQSHHSTRPNIVIAAATHNIELKSLRAMFNLLIKYNEWKLENPLKNIQLMRSSERELAFLSKEQIPLFLDKVANDKSPLSNEILIAIKICLSTGARIGEALSLNYSNITHQKLIFTDTKSKKNRSVPISSMLYDEIINVSPKAGNIFTVSYYACWECVRRALPPHVPKGQATHILRHTFASYFMINGGNILVLQRILGHSKIDQTMAYAHFSPDHLMEAVRLNPLT